MGGIRSRLDKVAGVGAARCTDAAHAHEGSRRSSLPHWCICCLVSCMLGGSEVHIICVAREIS